MREVRIARPVLKSKSLNARGGMIGGFANAERCLGFVSGAVKWVGNVPPITDLRGVR